MSVHFEADEVAAICHRKRSDPELARKEVRPHPELPKVDQYLVLVEDEEEAVDETRLVDMFKLSKVKKNKRSSSDDDGGEDCTGFTCGYGMDSRW